MNADEIVRELRAAAAKWEAKNKFIGTGELRVHDALNDAADLIESLQAEVAKWKERHNQAALNFQQENRENQNLQAQLAESQRRERAAVEDMTKLATKPITPCHSCSKTCLFPASLAPELQPATWCRDWRWRGPQEAGEGENNAYIHRC